MKKSVFERMVEKAFSGLEARYSFKKTETKFENRSCDRPLPKSHH